MTTGTSEQAKGVLRALDLQLLGHAGHYDLTAKEERLRSNQDLEALFFRLLRGFKPQLFVEAGAKEGGSSRRARKLLPEARVVAFEANPYTHERFAKKNAAATRVEYLHLALDREPGTVTFNVREREDGQPHADGQGSLGKRFDHAKYREVTVSSTSLDAFFADLSFERCALWVDVEGAAEQVLAGASAVLGRTCVAIIEIDDRLRWQAQTWRACETMECFYAAGLVPIARDFQSRYQYNMVFARAVLLDDDNFRLALAEHTSKLAMRSRGHAASGGDEHGVRKLKQLARDSVALVKDSRVYQRYFGTD